MAAAAVAIDPGSQTWKVLVLEQGKTGLAVRRFGAAPAAAGAQGLAELGLPLRGAVAGLAGRAMTMRYAQVPPSPDWQLRSLMELEIQDIAGQSGGELSADYNLLPGTGEEAEMDMVLMALARNEALAETAATVADAAGSVIGHVPNCIAIYNAYLRTMPVEDDQVVCLVGIGRETTDIALVRGADLLFARNLSTGSKVIDDAIQGAFDVSARKADSLKRELVDLDPESRGRYASGQAEKVTLAAGGAGSAFVSGIQSSLAFCKAQTKAADLRLDRVLICGGGARLRGIRGMLREALQCPVELFDPFAATDLSALPAEDASQLEELRLEAVVALGLAISRIDEKAYELEILPESVRRKQRFAQRTVFDIAAGVVAAVLLVTAVLQGRREVATATAAERRIASQVRAVQRTHEAAAALIDQNETDRAVVEALSERAMPLHGLLRTMRALHAPDMLPPEAWITSIEIARTGRRARAEEGTGDETAVVVKGAIVPISGRPVGQIYQQFSKRFREHELLASAAFQARVDDDSEARTTFTFTIDYTVEPAVATEAAAGQEQQG